MVYKNRLDSLLFEKGLFASRACAQSAIMAGQVFVDGQKVEKSGTAISPAAKIEIRGEKPKYVSRGGLKLEKALKEFNVNPSGQTCLDIGASTGGFTDCLLQGGAAKVFAVDVGRGQLDWKLQKDPRVIRVDKTNARYLTAEVLSQAAAKHNSSSTNPGKPGAAGGTLDIGLRTLDIGLCVIDVSFISLAKIFPAVYQLLTNHAKVIALVKPQFEAGRGKVGKGGIVRDQKVIREVLAKTEASAEQCGFKVKGICQSPIKGADGNVEYLMYLAKN
jgi:23S rRNA (cytidine1920-2'-O)/16S rRNA (cytidine1409-2'-O)-methyltransferase